MLAPLAGRDASAWAAAPGGKWSPGQIVAHLTVAIERSAAAITARADKPPMRRRPLRFVEWAGQILVLRYAYFPPGRRAPETTLPPSLPDRAATEARLRTAVAAFLAAEAALLPARARNLFVKHPVLGDLCIAEWRRFHEVHAGHHLEQINQRLKA